MEKKAKGDHVEGKKNKSPLWADLYAESHDIISDEQLLYSDEATESAIVTCAENIAVEPEPDKIPRTHFESSLGISKGDLNAKSSVDNLDTSQRFHDKDKRPRLKIAMAVMALMGICVWSWVLVINTQVKSPIPRVIHAQMVGQTLMESTPMLLPVKMIPRKVALPVDHSKNLGETLRHIELGKQALKERYISKAIDNFMRARQILTRFPHAKADFLHRELNALHANALYWQGFLALQKQDQCQARAYFVGAQAMAPHDKKIQDRLKEIPSSLGC